MGTWSEFNLLEQKLHGSILKSSLSPGTGILPVDTEEKKKQNYRLTPLGQWIKENDTG